MKKLMNTTKKAPAVDAGAREWRSVLPAMAPACRTSARVGHGGRGAMPRRSSYGRVDYRLMRMISSSSSSPVVMIRVAAE